MAESNSSVDGRVEKTCKPCSVKGTKRLADIYCSTCHEFQCNDCTSYHKVVAAMMNHNLIPVIECPGELHSDLEECGVVDMKEMYTCKKHYKQFEFYCKDDEVLACSSCAILDHKKCDQLVDIAASADDGPFKELQDIILKSITKTRQAVENLKEAKTYVSKDAQLLTKQIDDMKKWLLECVNKLLEEVTEEENQYRDSCTAAWKEKEHECEKKIKTLKSILKIIDLLALKGTKSQQFIAGHCMREMILNEVKDADSLFAELKVLKVFFECGEAFDRFATKMKESQEKCSKVEINFNVPRTTSLELIASVDLIQTDDDAGMPVYSGLDFLPDGRLVVVDNKNGKCLVYDELNLMTAYKLPYKHPQSVVAVSDDEVAITTGGVYRLDFLKVDKSNEITLNRTCTANVKYKSISVKDDENFVVGTIDYNPPVRIVSTCGEERDFDMQFPSRKYPISMCYCTYIRDVDKVVLTDRDEDTVHIHDTETGEKTIIKDELIKAPCDVAVGPCNHVFVASVGTRSIVEITPCGRVLSSLKNDMICPYALAASKDKRILAVFDAGKDSRTLSLYRILTK